MLASDSFYDAIRENLTFAHRSGRMVDVTTNEGEVFTAAYPFGWTPGSDAVALSSMGVIKRVSIAEIIRVRVCPAEPKAAPAFSNRRWS